LVSSGVPADPTVGGTVVGEGADAVQAVRRAGVVGAMGFHRIDIVP
jgi:hypothetical protein